MEERPLFIALTKSSTLLGLPYAHAVFGIVACALPLIWFISIWTVIWCASVYVGLRVASATDDKAAEALLKSLAATPVTQSRKIFGGDSYGP